MARLVVLSFMLGVFWICSCFAHSSSAIADQGNLDFGKIEDQAVANFVEYLKIDTTNPPGNEIQTAQFLKNLLDKEGIESTVYLSAPGRANLYAIIKGSNPSKGALLLTNHMDVVPADGRYWKYPPFSGKIVNGVVWGRGALDMKGLGLVELEAMIALKRSGIRLKRDVIYLAVCDEETGGKFGTSWMLEKHPELFRDVAGVINEEGFGTAERGKLRYWEIRPGQKSLLWLLMIAHGNPGHGSIPFPQTAPKRLIQALYRIIRYQTPVKILPEAREFFKALSRIEKGRYAGKLADLDQALKAPGFVNWLVYHPKYNAFLRATINVTQLAGSNKTNVVPAEASASLDCRLLPGSDANAFVKELKRVAHDPAIEFRPILLSNAPPSSPLDTGLFRAISAVIHRHYPGVPILTPYSTAANDSAFFQRKGIISYGFFPFVVSHEDMESIHGNNERLSVENVKNGVKMLYEIISEFDKTADKF